MKLNFKVQGQCLTLSSAPSCIVGGSVNYLDAAFVFSSDWDGLAKTAFFECGDIVYEALIESDGKITDGINLSAGTWTVHVLGVMAESDRELKRITTGRQSLRVDSNGADEGDPLPVINPTLAEQILTQATKAASKADAVYADAQAGKFDGAPGPKGDKGDKGDPGGLGTKVETWIFTLENGTEVEKKVVLA